MDPIYISLLLMFGTFFVMLFLGVPIAIGIGLASVATVLFMMPPDIVAFAASQKIVGAINSFILLAIIFFVLAGVIMNNGGIAMRLINLAKLLVGRIPGSLAHTNVVGNMLFGAISGSAVAGAAAIGSVMAPIQKKEGYEPAFAASVNIASAPAGLLIPPSGVLILYSMVSGGTSITALFIAGLIPGILLGLSVMIAAFFMARKHNYPIQKRLPLTESLKVVWDAIPSLMMLVIVVGGIVAGFFTATEASAIAVVYSLILAVLYKTVTWKDIPKILKETAVTCGIVLFLVGTSSIMAWSMSIARIPNAINDLLLSVSENPIVIMLLILVILLIIGTFLDLSPAVLIFTPIFLPIVTNIGIDPVHFGIIMIFVMSIGVTTPPVGSVLFVGCSIYDVQIERVISPLLRLYVAMVIALLFVTFFPQISLWMPKLLGVL